MNLKNTYINTPLLFFLLYIYIFFIFEYIVRFFFLNLKLGLIMKNYSKISINHEFFNKYKWFYVSLKLGH